MGRVHRPEALSSSSKMVMMGTNFCLLSSDDTKLLSSWMEHGQHGGHLPGILPWQGPRSGGLWSHVNTFPNSVCPSTQAQGVADLQCGQVASQLFDDGLKGTSLGLGITHKAQVEEQGVAAVFLVLDAHRAANQFLLHGCARQGGGGARVRLLPLPSLPTPPRTPS